jgi:hypothetical protein
MKITTFVMAVLLIGSGVGLWNVYGRALTPLSLEKSMSQLPAVVNLGDLPPLDQNRPEKTEFALFALG